MSLFGDYPVTRTVPDFVGLDYDGAADLQPSVGLHLADPGPDAPPILNYWWEHKELVVLTQSPSAGCRIDRKVSVTVTLGPPEEPVGARVQNVVPPPRSAEVDGDETSHAHALSLTTRSPEGA